MSNSFMTPQTGARPAPLPIGFPRQESWRGLPFPPLGYLPDPGIEPASPAAPAMTRGFFTTELPWKPLQYDYLLTNKPCNISHSKWEKVGDWVLTQFLPSRLKANYRRKFTSVKHLFYIRNRLRTSQTRTLFDAHSNGKWFHWSGLQMREWRRKVK